MIGFITVKTHPRARVRVDGVDVSSRCFAADDERGFADCYRVNADGQKFLTADKSGPAKERLTGRVEIDFPNGLD